ITSRYFAGGIIAATRHGDCVLVADRGRDSFECTVQSGERGEKWMRCVGCSQLAHVLRDGVVARQVVGDANEVRKRVSILRVLHMSSHEKVSSCMWVITIMIAKNHVHAPLTKH